MAGPVGRRLGAILVIVILLSILLVPAASAGGCGVYHRVRLGENLTTIAAKYHVSIWAIASANHISNIDRIYAGQVLWIPGVCPPPRPPKPPAPPPHHPPHHPPVHPPMATPWVATYFNNRDLGGAPVWQQAIHAVNFNWGFGSPAPNVPVDNFSARFMSSWYVGGGNYRLLVRSDDGFRVFVDGQMVLSDWSEHPVQGYFKDLYIGPGYHSFTMEYFEATGLAEAGLSFQRLH
jgi:LysM repeat protein